MAATAGTKPVSVDATTTTTARGEGVQTVTSLTLVTETSGGNRGVTSVPDVSESKFLMLLVSLGAVLVGGAVALRLTVGVSPRADVTMGGA